MADISEFFPDTVKELKEFKAMANIENEALNEAWGKLKKVRDEQFALTADEDGISRYEKICSVTKNPSDSLDERRFNVLVKMAESAPYTMKTLKDKLALLCGENGYKLERDCGEKKISIKVELANKKKLIAVRKLFERALPVNMIYVIDLLYNRWLDFENHTWEDVSGKSWFEMREEVI